MKRNESFDKWAKDGAEKGDIGVIFLGDSITQGWEGKGAEVWKAKYAPRGAVNMGIGCDRTQHVLRRLEHGNIDGLAKPKSGTAPKLVVLMIGTNNSNGIDHSAEEIAEGIKAVVSRLREGLAETGILMLDIFPRGLKPNAQREKNARASELAASAADGKWVHCLDVGPAFLEPDGTLSKGVMPDNLHPSALGCRCWAEAMEPRIRKLLGEDKQAESPGIADQDESPRSGR
ncbi:MAG: GDSL-type esterase/lipase family protein [Phycisphaerales bacterium]